jgi:hypothetical protein
MKTIITTLPIYDKIAKQCYQRAARARQETDKPFPIICPRHRLPSYQYNAEAVAVGAVTRIDLVDMAGSLTDITTYFPTLSDTHTVGTDVYYKYDGGTLNYLMTVGIYYLKITHANGYVYYSEWFHVDCVYENLITTWTNSANPADYRIFTANGPSILMAEDPAPAPASGYSNNFSISPQENITVIFLHTQTFGTIPILSLLIGASVVDTGAVVAGLNAITLTSTIGGTAHLEFSNTDGVATQWNTSDVNVIREYSTKYLTLNFHNDCDLGDILYHTGWNQSMWFESEAMEMLFPQEEEGVKNGEGQFIRSFARQDKKYIARTKQMPDYMVDVFNRMKLHETIELIDLVGDVHDVYNLEVDHEWLDNDKYYARINLTFDYGEAFVIAGCCNNF